MQEDLVVLDTYLLHTVRDTFGWKRIKGLGIAKVFQCGGHVVDIMHNEVSRNLHFFHVHTMMRLENLLRWFINYEISHRSFLKRHRVMHTNFEGQYDT